MDLDFGFGGGTAPSNGGSADGNNGGGQVTDLGTGGMQSIQTSGEDADDLDDAGSSASGAGQQGGQGQQAPANQNGQQGQQQAGDQGADADKNKGQQGQQQNGENNDENAVELTEGMTIDADGNTYTVDKDGNLVDTKGVIFKEAKDVSEWIKSFDQVTQQEAENEVSITSVQEHIGLEILDDNDQPIQFENTPEGIAAYIDAVNEIRRDEHYETAVNTLYQNYPFIGDMINYYVANGNSLEGYNEVPDRSNIVIDDSNEAQQESIIRTAWKEQSRTGDVEGYIAYLKSSGTLNATAKTELQGLQQADKQRSEQLAEQAAQAEEEQRQAQIKYWGGVKETIDKRVIAGYSIPESIIVTRNGQKISATPNDFFNYIYQVDKDGVSAYQKDLQQTDKETRRDDEILKAYLKFTGGNYASLVNMALNKEKVNNLKLKSKESTSRTIKITSAKPNANGSNGIDVGYN